MTLQSRMFREAAQAAARSARAAAKPTRSTCARIGALLREIAPRAVVTCARGSSDHAATFAKYLIETRAKVLTSSAAPSVSSLYAAQPDLRGVAVPRDLAVGREPGPARRRSEAAKRGGALVIALCNATDSPLAALADHVDAAVRRRGDERRGDEILHRVADRDRAPRRELDRESAPAAMR